MSTPNHRFFLSLTLRTEAPVTISRAVDTNVLKAMGADGKVLQASDTVPITQAMTRAGQVDFVPCITAHHLRGKLRHAAAWRVANALSGEDDTFPWTLDDYYMIVHGGHGFQERQTKALGAEQRQRRANPILGLFGGSNPNLSSALHVVDHCAYTDGMAAVTALPEGQRRNDAIHSAELQHRLAPEELQRVARDDQATQERSQLNAERQRLDRDRKRAARQNQDTSQYDERLKEIDARLDALKDEFISENTIDRPLERIWAIAPGVHLDGHMRVMHAYPAEMGLFLDALRAFGADPRIGGHQSIGCGLVSGEGTLYEVDGDGKHHEAGRVRFGGTEGFQLTDTSATVQAAQAAWQEVLEAGHNATHAGQSVAWTRPAIDALGG